MANPIKASDKIAARNIKPKTVNEQLMNDFLRWRIKQHMYANDGIVKILARIQPTINHLLSTLPLTIHRFLNTPHKHKIKYSPVHRKALTLMEAEEPPISYGTAREVADRVVELINASLGTDMMAVNEDIRTLLLTLSVMEQQQATDMILARVPPGFLLDAGIVFSGELPVSALLLMIEEPLGGLKYASRLELRYGAALSRVKTSLTNSLAHGEGVEEAVRRVKPWLSEFLPTQIQRLVRTELLRVANSALKELYIRNKDIIKKEMWVATLDWRTCLICANLDGNQYPVGEGPIPPIHPQCRCIRIPITKSFRELGLDIEETPPGMRASMNGAVPATTTFEGFFRAQDSDFQKLVLGPSRYKLWVDGKIQFDQFATATRIRTLDELQPLIA